MRNGFLLGSAIVVLLYGQALLGQTFSYVDENGDRVLTNIAPISHVSDLRITGEIPPPPPTPSNSKTKFQAFDTIIEKYASDYRLHPDLIRSIIATESGFNPKAVSPKGARGLMQLMPATAKRLGVQNSFDPEQNIQGGAKHFRFLMDSFNEDLELSLAAYNAGENLVQRLGRVPEIKETLEYVRSITKRFSKNEKHIQSQEIERRPETYKFVDESGVLHLTNIPPIR